MNTRVNERVATWLFCLSLQFGVFMCVVAQVQYFEVEGSLMTFAKLDDQSSCRMELSKMMIPDTLTRLTQLGETGPVKLARLL
eukprot:1775630-Amphidinium_carterae.1